MIAADSTGWYGLAGTLIVVVGGIVVALIQTGRITKVVRSNAAELRENTSKTVEVLDHVNNVEGEVGPDGEVVHRTLSQRLDDGFARNAHDHRVLFDRLGVDETHIEEHEVRITEHDGRLDALDREVGA